MPISSPCAEYLVIGSHANASDMKKQESKLTYESAYTELQHIMQEVQSEAIGIDDLTAKIARASELIRFCRERLRMTEEEVRSLTLLRSGPDLGG